MKAYRFSKTINADFSDILRKRVNAYFKNSGISKNANSKMVTKTVIALLLYLTPFFLIISGQISNYYILFGLWLLMGMGNALVGTSVMHDAVHGSYSKNRKVNSIMSMTAPMVGMDAVVWRIQHNVLHHSFTNIEHADDDIAPRYVMRFSPHQPKMWFHRFQHIYVWFFYSLSTLLWVTMKDYFKLNNYRKKGHIKSGKEFNTAIIKMFFRKMIYLAVFLGMPLYFLNVPASVTVSMFVAMHLVAGLCLSLVFQPAHVISTSEFIDQEELEINENWSVHQLKTTTNFAMKSKLITWFTGGLNFQVEHHLFPNVCHVHYPKIAKIVQETAEEFNLPYYAKETFISAVSDHFITLKKLGKA